MRSIRRNIFETNSSSTHALVVGTEIDEHTYLPHGHNLLIRWIDTDDESVLTTLKDKVSYLVSHIASWYMYDVRNYEELLDMIQSDRQFQKVANIVEDMYHKQIVFPEKYDGDISEIVNINHQLISWNDSLEDILSELVKFDEDAILRTLFKNGSFVEFDRD